MTRRISQDHNYRTACPAAIKAKITALESAVMDYANALGRCNTTEAAQVARYNLERTILTCIEAAAKATREPEQP